jgi:hypothetical protein
MRKFTHSLMGMVDPVAYFGYGLDISMALGIPLSIVILALNGITHNLRHLVLRVG